jgi:simple sugar transport system permease protein
MPTELSELLTSTLRLSIPLIFAAFGGLLSERSGIANIALEAYLLVSAFAAGAVTFASGHLMMGVIAGVAASGIVGCLFAAVCIWGRGDQIVVGTGFNLLAVGLLPVLTKAFFGLTGSTPSLPLPLRFSQPSVFFGLAVITLILLFLVFHRTRHGLRIIAAGENPNALSSQGVSYRLVRFRAVVEGSLIAGVGGVYLSLCQGSGYVREMSAGRGFIALAALIFGAWKPLPTFLACLFFAFADAIQIQLQGAKIAGWAVPSEFVQIVPYVATLFVLAAYSRKMQAPAALNQEAQSLSSN